MSDRTDDEMSTGTNEEKAAHPSEVDEVVEGGRAVEDSPIIPGGATAATTENVADPDDEPDSSDGR